MRLILATESANTPSPTSSDTLRTDTITACGEDVEISASAAVEGEVTSSLLALVAGERRPGPTDRPWVLLNMVSSADGATAGVEGRSASLSGDADRDMFHALRSISDVVLAGASTVRTENYGAARLVAGAEAVRTDRGQAPLPRLAVVTGSLRLDPAARLFQETSPDARPIVLTTTDAVTGAPDRSASLAAVADVRQVGDDAVDWPAALRLLRHDYDARTLLVEGGPTVNAQLVEQDLVDELCLTISPLLLGGSTQRILAGVPAVAPRHLSLDRVLEDQGFLLLRYLRRR